MGQTKTSQMRTATGCTPGEVCVGSASDLRLTSNVACPIVLPKQSWGGEQRIREGAPNLPVASGTNVAAGLPRARDQNFGEETYA